MKRRFLSIILAMALMLSLGVAAGATDPASEPSDPNGGASEPTSDSSDPTTETTETTTEATEPTTDETGSVGDEPTGSSNQTVLKGTIKATKITATVPSKVSFLLDPIANAGEQVIQPEITITNDSMVPVYASISELDVDDSSGVKLVNSYNYLRKSKGLLFALLAKDVAIDYDNIAKLDPSTWLTADSVDADSDWVYSLRPADCGLIAAKGGTMPLRIHAYTLNGWKNEDQFTITPTIIISLTAPENDSISNS